MIELNTFKLLWENSSRSKSFTECAIEELYEQLSQFEASNEYMQDTIAIDCEWTEYTEEELQNEYAKNLNSEDAYQFKLKIGNFKDVYDYDDIEDACKDASMDLSLNEKFTLTKILHEDLTQNIINHLSYETTIIKLKNNNFLVDYGRL